MRKKRAESKCDGPDFAVGAKVRIKRPHLWHPFQGVVVSVTDHKHLVLAKGVSGGFHTEVCGSELEAS